MLIGSNYLLQLERFNHLQLSKNEKLVNHNEYRKNKYSNVVVSLIIENLPDLHCSVDKYTKMENQNGGAADDHRAGRSDCHVAVDIDTVHEFSDLLQSHPTKLYSQSRRQIQKVPPQIRRRTRRSDRLYDPAMVSIGPYHHGKPELRRAEEFKRSCLDRRGGDERKAFFYSKILAEIAAVRDSYAETAVLDEYDDKSLALMMLLDSSIIIDFIHNYLRMNGNSFSEWQRFLGARSVPLMFCDMMVLENQIPFRILKLLIDLQYEEDEAASFIPRFILAFMGCNIEMEQNHEEFIIPQEKEDPPIHILEALWRFLVKKQTHKHAVPVCDQSSETENRANRFLQSGFSMREENVGAEKSYMHRSVMELKAKGITVIPNPELSVTLRGITFKPSFFFSRLELPIQYFSDLTPAVVANLIAFEILPNGCDSLIVLSYATFMKSLIQRPEDVKEMQDNGIWLNRFANLERVVEMIKEIDTFGLHDQDIFKDVKRRIEEHCSSRARTWIADLIYTRFRSPWTAIAFLAAVLLLSLAFLQTFFTIRPINERVN